MASSTSVWQEKIYHALTGIDDYLQAIIDKLELLDDINDKLDYLESIDVTLTSILGVANDLKDLAISMDATLTSIDNHQNHISDTLDLVKVAIDSINTKIDAVNGYLADIKTNTGAIITPINNLKISSDTLVSNSNYMKNDLHKVSEYIDNIADNTGDSAAFAEQIATNTLNAYNKIVTIASDTTDLRTNMLLIVDLLQQINNKIQ